MKLFFFSFFIFSFSLMAQVQNPGRFDKRWKTDLTKHSVDLSEFIALMPRDGFKVLNNPSFLNMAEGLNNYFEHEPVIAVVINNSAKAYPLNILTYHEISNDELEGTPLLVTYCPLCNSGMVFHRRLNVNGETKTASFAVSGMLRKSSLVMWDDVTESWWQQLIGEAVVGKMTGTKLELIPSQIISVKEFFNNYPEGKILSNKTGFTEAEEWYGKNRYVSYDSLGSNPYRFFQQEVDLRLPAKERVIDINSMGKFKIYPFSKITEKGVINDEFNFKKIVIFHQPGTVSVLDKQDLKEAKDVGTATVFNSLLEGQHLTFKKAERGFVDEQTNSLWTITGKCIDGKLKGKQLTPELHGNHMAFSWFAFYPDSEIYE